MKKLAIVVGLAMLCSGCAIVGGGRPSEESGEKVWSIMGSNENWAFNNADKLCPHGYYVHDERPNRPLPPVHLMEIECKPATSGQVDLVLTPPKTEEYNPLGLGKSGQYSFEIEHNIPQVRACHDQPIAILESKTPGVEVYKIDCTNGTSLTVRCEYSNCAVK